MADGSPAARIARLRSELRRHDHLYWVDHQPEISDEQYDRLMVELRSLEAAHPELVTPDSPTQRVGEQLTEGFRHVVHALPMLSIDNTYNEGELREFDGRVRKLLADADVNVAPIYLCEPKIDGVAISLRYEGGFLNLAATRGDGESGDDVTHNVRVLRSVPLALHGERKPDVLEIRGEIFWPRSDFDAVNARRTREGLEPFKNPRNATAGTLKQLDPRVVAERRLVFQAHGFGVVEPWPQGIGRHSEFIALAREWGIAANLEQRSAKSIEEVVAYVVAWDARRREVDYDTDGVVIKVDQLELRDVLGATSKAPRWCIAYKYASEQGKTRLLAVTLQVGKLGTITPVAELEPVELAGTTVRRASLHNFDQIERLGLRVGDLVTVEKSGEIIPQVIAVDLAQRPAGSTPIKRPSACPECGGEVRQDENGVYLRCVNPACPAQRLERLKFFCGRDQMDIDGAGAAVIEALVGAGWVERFADLYSLGSRDPSELAALSIAQSSASGAMIRLGEKRAAKLLEGIAASRGRPLARVLTALNVRHVGATTAELLAQHFGDVDRLMTADESELMGVEGVGPEVAGSLRRWLDSAAGRETIESLRAAGVNLTQPQAARRGDRLAGMTVVVTGTLERHGRKEIESLIKQHGGKTASSVSKKTDLVVAGENAGSKLAKARELGVRVVTEAEFEALLGE